MKIGMFMSWVSQSKAFYDNHKIVVVEFGWRIYGSEHHITLRILCDQNGFSNKSKTY